MFEEFLFDGTNHQRPCELPQQEIITALTPPRSKTHKTKGWTDGDIQTTPPRKKKKKSPKRERGPNFLKNRATRLRQQARKQLSNLLDAQDGLCYFCHRPILDHRDIPDRYLTKRTTTSIYWLEDGVEVSCLIATIEHVVPISEGGQNADNIVASCYDCNMRRSEESQNERKSQTS